MYFSRVILIVLETTLEGWIIYLAPEPIYFKPYDSRAFPTEMM